MSPPICTMIFVQKHALLLVGSSVHHSHVFDDLCLPPVSYDTFADSSGSGVGAKIPRTYSRRRQRASMKLIKAKEQVKSTRFEIDSFKRMSRTNHANMTGSIN